MNSVLQDWVMELPLREQGVLLTGVRGCDFNPKAFSPDDLEYDPARRIVQFLRYCYLNPADPREVDSEPGCWFRSTPPEKWRPSQLFHYPLHWVSHVMHTAQVIGYRCPNRTLSMHANDIYVRIVWALHLLPEPFEQYAERLSEDRIAKGNIVS